MLEKLKEQVQDWRLAALLSLTIGLAPFYPEPHIVGKIKWIAGGAVGMTPLDWFDFFYHGLPWVYLLYVLNKQFFK